MPVTATDIVNEAIQLIGANQPPVTGNAPNFDGSTAGKAAAFLYAPAVQTVGRQWGWDFARRVVALTATSNTAPFPWAFEYLYPADGIQIWQLMPATLADPNNPLPVNWSVGNTLVGSNQKKVIWSNQTGAVAAYNNNPAPDTWDPLFREAVVRLLASEMAMALAGKPDTAQGLIETGGAFESLGEQRGD